MAASLLGIVLRGAKALDPIRERTRRITLPDVREERRVRAIERYRAFIDSASDGIVVLDGAGSVLYMNRAAEEVTGYARDGLAGKPLVQIVPEPFRAMLERQIGRAIAGEPVDNFDLELVTTSGDRITVSVASIGILSEHEAAIFSFRDVTLARELERELRRTSEFLEPHPQLDGRRHHRRRTCGARSCFSTRAPSASAATAPSTSSAACRCSSSTRRASRTRSCASSARPNTAAAGVSSRCAAT